MQFDVTITPSHWQIDLMQQNGTSSNTTALFKIRWEQFPMGMIYLIFALISLIWLLCLRSIFKNRISLQRQLFLFIMFNFLARGIQMTVVHSFCFKEENLPSCKYIDNVSQTLDIFASAFNFTVYLVLVAFWAEQYYAMIFSADPKSIHVIRKKINIVFWILLLISYMMVTVVSILTFALPPTMFGYPTEQYQYTRLAVRLCLNLSICIGLAYYGLAVYRRFRIHYDTKRHLVKIAYITVFCGLCYLLLAIYNVVITPFHKDYEDFEYAWIFYNSLSLVEIAANALLLFSMTPPLITDKINMCLALCSRKYNTETLTSASSSYISLDASIEQQDYDVDTESEDYNEEQYMTAAYYTMQEPMPRI